MSDEKKKRGRPPKHSHKTKTGIRCDLFNGEKDELDRATDRVLDPKTNKPIPQSDFSRQSVLFAAREINSGHLPVWDERYGALAMFGEAAAGVPILNYDDPPDWKRLQDLFPSGHGLGLLKIRGKSMVDAGILDGDFVVVRKADTADKGQRVVALVDSGLTVKKLDWEGRGDRKTYYLVPESADHERIQIGGANDGRIVGVLVGVIRTY